MHFKRVIGVRSAANATDVRRRAQTEPTNKTTNETTRARARASLLQPLGLGLPVRLGLLLRAARRGHRFVRGAERAAGFVQLDLQVGFMT